MERRDMMKLLATMPLGAWALSGSEVADAATHTHAADRRSSATTHAPRASPPHTLPSSCARAQPVAQPAGDATRAL